MLLMKTQVKSFLERRFKLMSGVDALCLHWERRVEETRLSLSPFRSPIGLEYASEGDLGQIFYGETFQHQRVMWV